MNDIRSASVGAFGGTAPLPKPSATELSGDTGFGDLISAGLRDAARSLGVAEASAISGLTGAAPVQDVVSAVMNAEHKLQLAVSVRDKIVSAYLEISRMQI